MPKPYLSNRRSLGLSLGAVLIGMLALTLIVFTASTAAISHLHLVESAELGDHARNIAEATLAKAMAELNRDNFALGRNRSDRVTVSFGEMPDASGVLTFDPGEPGFGSGYSLSNLDRDSATTGAGGRQVPGRTLHLVARGRAGSAERWVECLYYRPPFPDGLSATGRATARSVHLTGVRNASAYGGGDPTAIAREDALPANLFSNAVTSLSGTSLVTGSVGAVASVEVSPECVVQGEILPGSEPRSVPDLRLDEKIATIEGHASPVSSSAGSLTLEKNFLARSDGDLRVQGDLDLNGSVLVVKAGDLWVQGAVKGTGIILSEGDVEIRDGGSAVTTAEQVAVGCKGDFRLRAASPEGNYFQGLVYAEGEVDARDITVVGAVVGNGKDGASGDVTLDNVRFIYNPGAIQVATFPVIVTASRRSGGQPYAAFTASVRPKPDNTGWLVNAWAGVQLAPISGNRASNEAMTVEQLRARGPGSFVEQTWTDLPFNTFGPWDPNEDWVDFQPGDELASEHGRAYDLTLLRHVGPWLDSQTGKSGQPGDRWYDRFGGGDRQERGDPMMFRVIDDYRLAQTARDDSRVLRFHLNKLLTEANDNSRVLLWRPFTP